MTSAVEITYLGNSAVVIAGPETTLLIDPYITDNVECPIDVEEVVERYDPDVILVTHAAFDHVGDAAVLGDEYDTPIITEPATEHYLRTEGVIDSEIIALVWGMSATVGEFDIRVLETRHVSVASADGKLVSGLPLSFLIEYAECTVYHLGDTSIFADLQLVGMRYEPDLVFVGVGQAVDMRDEWSDLIQFNIAELTIDEAIQVCEWIGSDAIVPIHYLPDELTAFVAAADTALPDAEILALDPLGTVQLDESGALCLD